MTEERKEGPKWHTNAKRVALPVLTSLVIAAVDLGLLQGALGQALKAAMQSLQLVA